MTYFFIGDGSEVLACEAYEANALAELKRLQAEQPGENFSLYECDPSELTQDSAGNVVFAYPAERALAEREYDLPNPTR